MHHDVGLAHLEALLGLTSYDYGRRVGPRLTPVTCLVDGPAVAVQFFQYVLPGCDALGYTACTGTNFCVRAQALAKVGVVRMPHGPWEQLVSSLVLGHVHSAVPWAYGISSCCKSFPWDVVAVHTIMSCSARFNKHRRLQWA